MEASWLSTDFYAVLGVDKAASAAEVTKAYRRLAKKYHPDSGSGDDARFKEVASAYEVIGDAVKRAEYDAVRAGGARPGRTGTSSAGAPGWPGARGAGIFGDGDGFSGIFGDFMAQTARRRLDVSATIELSLEDVDAGGELSVSVLGEQVRVHVPAGVAEGTRLRVLGRGRADEQGGRGDLYLEVSIKEHPLFIREGDDLGVTASIPWWTCVLGGQVEVMSLDGPVMVKVKAGTRSGTVLRVAGRGLARLGGGRGDLRARVSVEVPTHLSAEQTAKVEALAEAFEHREGQSKRGRK